MHEAKRVIVSVLMPISAQLDDFLERHEYINSHDPSIIPQMISLMDSLQRYVNETYRELNVTVDEWKSIEKEVMLNEPKNNYDPRATGKREDNLDEGDAPPEPQHV